METNPIKIRQTYIRDFLINILENPDNNFRKKRLRKVIMNFLYQRLRTAPKDYIPTPIPQGYIVITLPNFARISRNKGKDTLSNWYLSRTDKAHFISYLNGIFFTMATEFIANQNKQGKSIENSIYDFIDYYQLPVDSNEMIYKFWFRIRKIAKICQN
jgi:hypothetical protein